MKTINITDYQALNANVAKVIVSTTGAMSTDEFKERLAAALQGQGQAIVGSFRRLTQTAMVGFIKAGRSIRVENEKSIEARYRVMAGNMLMDKEDQSLWDIKSGAHGQYLSRHGRSDITELAASAVHRTPASPRLSQVTTAKVSRSELVAFVDDVGNLNHGFAYASAEGKTRVMCFETRQPAVVVDAAIVGTAEVAVPAQTDRQVRAGLSEAQRSNLGEYWKSLYDQDPDWVRTVTETLDLDAAQ